MPTRNLLDWIALSLLPGMGPILLRRALDRFGDPGKIAFRLPGKALESIPRMPAQSVAAILDCRRTLAKRAEQELRRSEKLGLRLLPCDHPDFPASFAELPDAPVLLHLEGRLPHDVVRVAVVGSRQPTEYGKRIAAGLASGLAARGIEVVSGGARGIDTCAHRSAVEEGGRTTAVLGSGFLQPYPKENERLFEQIAERGAVLSEFPLDQGPKPENFPRRNRLISGLAVAVVVVEANRRSGSLVTAGHALEQGREVMAVPGRVSSARSEGCHRLIQQGAKLVHCLDDILEELSPLYRGAIGESPDAGDPAPSPVRLPDEELTLGLLDETEPLQLDELADRVPFGIARLQAALFGLEVGGAIEALPGRHYVRRTRSATGVRRAGISGDADKLANH